MLRGCGAQAPKPESKPYKRADGGGLFILVQPDSKKVWRLDDRTVFHCFIVTDMVGNSTIGPTLGSALPTIAAEFISRARVSEARLSWSVDAPLDTDLRLPVAL
jgi:hypothetical protein